MEIFLQQQQQLAAAAEGAVLSVSPPLAAVR